MERYLVTGGAGFIGAHLTARLAERGAETIVVDDLSRGDESKLQGLRGVQLVRADVCELGRPGWDIGRFSHVFHLAARISASASSLDPDVYFATNVGGLLRTIELSANAARPPRFVFASTAGIYGDRESSLEAEIAVERPTTAYAATKLAGEQLLATSRTRLGVDDVSLRLFNVYGPGANPKHADANVVSRFAQAALRGEPVQLFGDGHQTRDFVYVDDVVDAMLAVAFQPTRERIYNVGTGRAVSLLELVSLVQRVSSKPLRVERHPARSNDIQHSRADVARLRDELGVQARIDLESGLGRTIAALVRPALDAAPLRAAQSP